MQEPKRDSAGQFVVKAVVLGLLTVIGVKLALGSVGVACLGLAVVLGTHHPHVRKDLIGIGEDVWQIMGRDRSEGHRFLHLVRIVAAAATAMWCARALFGTGA